MSTSLSKGKGAIMEKKIVHSSGGSSFNFMPIMRCGWFGMNIKYSKDDSNVTCKKCLKIMNINKTK